MTDANTPFELRAVERTPHGVRATVTVHGRTSTALLADIREASEEATPLGAFYRRVYEAARNRLLEADLAGSWFALVTFGSPSPSLPLSKRVGRGLRALDRLKRLADECKGSGSCSDARVVVRKSVVDAEEADISDGGVIYTA